jgi:Family of unknown function (DUF6288)
MCTTPHLHQAFAFAMACMACAPCASAQSFYREPPLFSKAPDLQKSVQTVDRFGPVGMSVELHQPAFVMVVGKIEEGSPAAATGKFKTGQIIESINSESLKDIDPRIQLGQMIEKAEAADGLLRFLVKDKADAAAQEVIVKIPVLGAYSKTWPLHCPKSDKIVRNFAEYLKKPGSSKGFSDIGMLFLLSTGEESDLAVVRDWARAHKGESTYAWHIGYGGMALCEYYLRTGDAAVLPAIQKMADSSLQRETFGGWGGGQSMAHVSYGGGGGHLNAGGTLAAAYLMLAKECGANIPDEPFHRILAHFYRFAGRGNNPYGNNKPETGYTDNGKNGKLAFVMAAAASLTPNGEKSVYARARDTNAAFSFYSTSYMLHGHTGGGIGEIWRSAAMGLLYEKKPNQYREFMDNRKWHYELSRRFDGSFAILGGERYDTNEWGGAYPLTYTIPRKTLRITGAPPSKYAKLYQLPERPWGTKADDDFENLEPAAMPDGTRPDISKETLANDAAMAMNAKVGTGLLDATTTRRYLRHPDCTVRIMASRSLLNLESSMLVESLTDKDARVRRAALEGILQPNAAQKLLTQDVFDRVIAMIKNPQESWFVKEAALRVVGTATADWLVPHVDLLASYLKHEEWWLQHSAIYSLVPLATDLRTYQKVIPDFAELARTNPLYNVTSPLRWGALNALFSNAKPEVQELAKLQLKDAFINHVKLDTRSIPAMEKANDANLEFIAGSITRIPGGYDMLYQIAKQRFPNQTLPYQALFLAADPGQFSPELKKAVRETIVQSLIPEYIGRFRKTLLQESKSEVAKLQGMPPQEGLLALYQSAGINDYDWKDVGPVFTDMKWQYLSFDPPEKMPLDAGTARYRPVTLPKGMEDWAQPSFKPQGADWKTGLQPIGHIEGKLDNSSSQCRFPFCRCGVPMQSLWEKEVLLMRGNFTLPAFKEGYQYRVLVGGMSHVSAGEGFRIYANGKLIAEKTRPVDKREGGRPIGAVIDKALWSEFQGGEVTLAAITFRHHKRQAFSIWLQEMKSPPLGEKEILQSAIALPMMSSEWQELQDPDNTNIDPEQGKFEYDGKFISNKIITGAWKSVGYVAKMDDFDPQKPREANRALFPSIDFKSDGRTDQQLWIWSGDTLMDLERNQALKMITKDIGGSTYLFIEAGGFGGRNQPGWASPWFVMKRP